MNVNDILLAKKMGLAVGDISSTLFAKVAGGGGGVDFATDSWETIKRVVTSGRAAEVYNVGDTREITLSDNSVHALRIANIEGNLYEYANGSGYTGFVVEFTDCFIETKFSSSNSNEGPLGNVDPVGATVLPAIMALFPEDLQSVLANVKVLASKGNYDRTIVSSDMKLFIPAAKELSATSTISSPAERAVLTTWAYYSENTGASYLKKMYNRSYRNWWLRSPNTSSPYAQGEVTNDGAITSTGAAGNAYISPCFCL